MEKALSDPTNGNMYQQWQSYQNKAQQGSQQGVQGAQGAGQNEGGFGGMIQSPQQQQYSNFIPQGFGQQSAVASVPQVGPNPNGGQRPQGMKAEAANVPGFNSDGFLGMIMDQVKGLPEKANNQIKNFANTYRSSFQNMFGNSNSQGI